MHLVTLNLSRRFREEAGLSEAEWIQTRHHLNPENIHLVSSAIYERYRSAYEGSPLANAAEFQKQIVNTYIKEIRSAYEGRAILHSNDWMAGGIITAYANLRGVPVLHTVHNTHTGHVPLEMFYGVNVQALCGQAVPVSGLPGEGRRLPGDRDPQRHEGQLRRREVPQGDRGRLLPLGLGHALERPGRNEGPILRPRHAGDPQRHLAGHVPREPGGEPGGGQARAGQAVRARRQRHRGQAGQPREVPAEDRACGSIPTRFCSTGRPGWTRSRRASTCSRRSPRSSWTPTRACRSP